MRIPFHQRRAAGFTLVEVVLAIVIAVGLLSGVLLFYRQAATLRADILHQTDQISALRLVMDRIASELRTIPASAGKGVHLLQGDSHSLRLLRTGVPSRSPWRGGTLGRTAVAEADLVEVLYRSVADTNEGGIYREEHAFTPGAAVSTNLVTEVEAPSTNSVPGMTASPLTEEIRYLRFRYWDGSQWTSTWERDNPPRGVEVTLGIEPLPEESNLDASSATPETPEDYPFEVFRRTIAIPTATGPGPGPGSGTSFPEEPAP